MSKVLSFKKNLALKINHIVIKSALLICLLSPIGAFYFSNHTAYDAYYPIWAYNLFYSSPEVIHDYMIELHELNNKKLESPKEYFELFPVYLGRFSPSVSISELGHAYVSKDESKIKIAREKFEGRALQRYSQGVYKIYQVTWNPLERYKYNHYVQKNWLADVRFQKD